MVIFALIAGAAVLLDYLRRRRRGDDPLGPRPAGDLPDTAIALLLGMLVWLVLRMAVVPAIARAEVVKDGGYPAFVLVATLANLVPALVVLRSATSGARRPTIPDARLVIAGVLAGFAVFALLAPVGFAIQAVIAYFGGELPRQEIVAQARLVQGPDRIAFVMSAVLLAPFAEEILFRGTLLPAVARAAGERKALVIQALVFGAIHIDSGSLATWPLAIPLAGVGWCAGWLYLKTGSLVPAILMHATFNAINFAALRASAPGAGSD